MQYNIVEDNLKEYLYWIIQRYKIHIKKDVDKSSYPWTEDPILQQASFTNVRRIEDRVTKFALENIVYNTDLSLAQKIINLVWFRIYNQPSTFELFNFPIRLTDLQNKQFLAVHDYYMSLIPECNTKLARGAYMISGVMNATYQDVKGYKTTMMPFHIIWKMVNTRTLGDLLNAIQNNECQKVFQIINGLRGIGQFLAYQIYIDLAYCKQTRVTQNDFVYPGNGALRGIELVSPGIPIKDRYKFVYYVQEHINEWMRKYYDTDLTELMTDLLIEDRCLSLSNIQNCFCQYSKYFKFKHITKTSKKRIYRRS